MSFGGTIGGIQLEDPIQIENQFSSIASTQVKRSFDGSYVVSSLVRTVQEGRYKLKVFWVTQAQMEGIRTLINNGTAFGVAAHTWGGANVTTITNARGIPGTDKFTAVTDGDFFSHDIVRNGNLDIYNGEFEVVGVLS